MINFKTVDVQTFLNEYWQKKPLIIRQALPHFEHPLSADELAGLAMEEDIESRMVFETPEKPPYWHLKRGPFIEKDFAQLPKTHWTLLVQGVDHIIPEVAALLDHFNFVPQWRIDDVMISYAVKEGSVGPHYDNYDVFLYQARGQRKWSLTTQNCTPSNYLKDVDLRIMKVFEVEEEYTLQEGDMLYLPPHVGHYGIALDDDCMTYSFGYRSYQGQELWDSLGDYLSEQRAFTALYQDPNWSTISATSAIPREAWLNAKTLIEHILTNEPLLKSWFGCFATRLDQQAEQHMPLPLGEEECGDLSAFIQTLLQCQQVVRDATCRIAYQEQSVDEGLQLFINGCEWETERVSPQLQKLIANHRSLDIKMLKPFLANEENQWFLYELWKLQWLQILD